LPWSCGRTRHDPQVFVSNDVYAVTGSGNWLTIRKRREQIPEYPLVSPHGDIIIFNRFNRITDTSEFLTAIGDIHTISLRLHRESNMACQINPKQRADPD
jgi:hypothetical protein